MTLTELLFVLTLIGILSFLVIPVVAAGKSAADGARCVANLRSLGLATLTYATENQGQLPPGRTWDTDILAFIDLPSIRSRELFRCPADARPASARAQIRSYTASGIDPNKPQKGAFSTRLQTVSRRLSQLDSPATTALYFEYFTNSQGSPVSNKFGRPEYSWMFGFESRRDTPKTKRGNFYHGTRMTFVFADGHASLEDPRNAFTDGRNFWQAVSTPSATASR